MSSRETVKADIGPYMVGSSCSLPTYCNPLENFLKHPVHGDSHLISLRVTLATSVSAGVISGVRHFLQVPWVYVHVKIVKYKGREEMVCQETGRYQAQTKEKEKEQHEG